MRLVGVAGMLTVAGILAGCSVGFPISRSEIGSPEPGAARLIIYRPSGKMLPLRSISVDVNGIPACDLPNGGGFAKDVGGSGETTVTAHLWDVDGKSSLTLKTETARTYFVRVRVAGETSPGAMSGLWGLGNGAAARPSGPFDLDLTDEASAIASGVELRRLPC
jgi:hypothetical protein